MGEALIAVEVSDAQEEARDEKNQAKGILIVDRVPRLIVPRDRPHSQRVVVVCSGGRENGRPCCRTIGEVNLNRPHDVVFICRDCGEAYHLQSLVV